VAREPASKLIWFSSAQAAFTILYLIQDILELVYDCKPGESSYVYEGPIQCEILSFSWLIIYQDWIWFAVLFNWKMFSLNEDSKIKKLTTDSFSNFAMNSPRSSAFLSPNN